MNQSSGYLGPVEAAGGQVEVAEAAVAPQQQPAAVRQQHAHLVLVMGGRARAARHPARHADHLACNQSPKSKSKYSLFA